MSVADLRARMADVPGIHNLSMQLELGRIVLKWGEGYSASVDAAGSDGDIEAAIRNAIRLPPIALIPDKSAVTTSTPAPPTQPTGQPTMTNPADAMKRFDDAMTRHAAMMEDLATAQVNAFEAKLARQRDSVTRGFGAMGDRIDAQTEAFDAMMSRFTNGAPA